MVRRMSVKRASILTGVMIVFVLPMTAVPALAEEPDNLECDGIAFTVAIACAGADGGGAAECTAGGPEAHCTYSYGWNLLAETKVPVPGAGELDWTYEVVACLNTGGCEEIESGGGARGCSWSLPDDPCAETGSTFDDASFTLEMGQCVTLTVTVQVDAAVWSADQDDATFAAEAGQTGTGAGAACWLDDGRD